MVATPGARGWDRGRRRLGDETGRALPSAAGARRRLRRRLRLDLAAAAFVALAVGGPGAAAQNGTLTGRVVDDRSGRPLDGAYVLVAGTAIGRATNAEGRFVLSGVPAGRHVVRADALGFAGAERVALVEAGETVAVEFRLEPVAVALDEIVVTGVGAETRRRALGTSVHVLAGETIEAAAVQSVDQLVQGRVPGAVVNAVSAQPGTGALVNFRGVSSVFGAQTPVIVVDGVRVDNDQATAGNTGGEQSSALSDLLVSDIERLEVTRGGAASTLFGSDAATGVIQIFTKKGRPGPPRITARMEQGLETPDLRYVLDAGVVFPGRVEAGEAPATFLRDSYFKNGHQQSYYLGVSGGTADVTYSVSGRLADRAGTQPKDASTSYNLRGGLQASVGDDFTLDFSGSYVRHNFERHYNGAAVADPLTTFEVGDALKLSGRNDLRSALRVFLMPDIAEQVSRFIFSSGARWRIRDGLSARVTLGADNRSSQQRIVTPIGFTPGELRGLVNRRDRTFTSVSLDAGATHEWAAPGGWLSSALTAGVQAFRDDESVFAANGRGFALPGSLEFDDAGRIVAAESTVEIFNGGLYLEERVSLWDKLYAGGGFRVDAGSSFGDEIDAEFYPKATAAYVLSDDWSPGFADVLKLRAAFGRTGKFPGAYVKDRTFASTSFRGEAAPRFASPGNPGLRPEKTSTFEAGLDAALLSNRVGVDFTFYRALTSDALFLVPGQPVSGEGIRQENVGEILNRGVEVAVEAELLARRSLTWSVGASFHYNDNRVADMGGVADFSVDESQKRVTLDLPVGAWQVTTPVDTNGDTLYDGSNLQYTGGSPVPDKTGSVTTTLSLRGGLSASVLADWAAGHEVFDWGSVWATSNGLYRRELVRCGTGAGVAGCPYAFPIQFRTDGTVRGRYSQSSARRAFLYDGDYFKLREVSVRYALPERVAARLGARRATVYASGRNLWTWSRNKMVDPELAGLSGGGLRLGGSSSITLPPNREFKLGVEVVF